MRKAFNFYKSYFDIYNEIETDGEKVKFITALLNKQFYGIEPTLSGMAKFAYISQKHSIDAQVVGYEKGKGLKLTPPMGGVTKGVTPSPPKEVQVQVQEKGKEQEKGQYAKCEILINYSFEEFWELYDKKIGLKSKLEKRWNRYSGEIRHQIMQHIPAYRNSQPDKRYRQNPETYFNNESWNNEIINKNQKNGQSHAEEAANAAARIINRINQKQQ